MRISKLTVKNFRSIESAEICPLAFNIFVGQNNHGKTNLFEAIEWFYNGNGDLKQIAYMRNAELEVSVEVEFAEIQAGIESIKNEKTKESFRKFADGKDIIRVIRRSSDDGKRLLWDEQRGEWSSKNFAGFDKAFNDCLPRLQYVSTQTRLPDISRYTKKSPIGEMLSGVLTAILEGSSEYRAFRQQFEELFGGEESAVRTELNNLGSKVKVHLSQQFPECAKVNFVVAEPAFDDLLKNFDTSVDDGVETSASEKGDGMQRALMLAILKTWAEYRRVNDQLGKCFLFLVDEAELHLHPSAQRQLKNALRSLSEKEDQVLVNTHSSVLVADDYKNQRLFKVHKTTASTIITPVAAQDKQHIVYELLGGSPADLLLPSNFLIVEGRTEFDLLRHVIRRHYPEKPNLQIVFAGGNTVKQERSMDAINTIFTPLFLTPIYRDRLVLLLDKPHKKDEAQYKQFRTAYAFLVDGEQVFVQPTCAIEEAYPAEWLRTAAQICAMSATEKTALGSAVGAAITKEDFEMCLTVAFNALQKAWEKAYL